MMMKATLSLALSLLPLATANPLLSNSQLPLLNPSNPSPSTSAGVTTLEVEAWYIFGIPVYLTPIAVGTPNQVFRAYIDLDFSGLLVRDTNCQGANKYSGCGYGGDQGFLYNATASTTYEDGDEKFDFMLPATFLKGSVGRDEVHLVNFGLENVTLGAVEEFYGENYFLLIMSDIADGAIGLAPPNRTASVPYSEHPTPNILSHLLSGSSLAKPMISFSLPLDISSSGITLGALPAGHDDVDISIPFGDLSEGWNVPVSSLALSPEKGDTIKLNTPSTLKVVPTFTAGLEFPHNLTQDLYKKLHALDNDNWAGVKEFNCSFRGQQPNISFSFPGAKEGISFSEEQYTIHGFLGEDEVCLLMITEFWGPPNGEVDDVVTIGTMLWDNWHVVFDLEEESMGLISREEEQQSKVAGERSHVELAQLRKEAREPRARG